MEDKVTSNLRIERESVCKTKQNIKRLTNIYIPAGEWARVNAQVLTALTGSNCMNNVVAISVTPHMKVSNRYQMGKLLQYCIGERYFSYWEGENYFPLTEIAAVSWWAIRQISF